MKIPVELRIHYDNHSLEHYFFFIDQRRFPFECFAFRSGLEVCICSHSKKVLPLNAIVIAQPNNHSIASVYDIFFEFFFYLVCSFFAALVKFINHIVVFIDTVLFFSLVSESSTLNYHP